MEQILVYLERLKTYALVLFHVVQTRFGSLSGIEPLDKLIGFGAALLVFAAIFGLPLYILFFRGKIK